MKKSKRMLRKLLLLTSSALLLVSLTVGVTLAYLTDTDTVTNTFTVGRVEITMDETKVNEYGETEYDENGYVMTVKANAYKLLPGHEYTKDPTVHVTSESESCYLFVKVVNGLGTIEDSPRQTLRPAPRQYKPIATQIVNQGWTQLEGYEGIYWRLHDADVEPEEIQYDYIVFNKFKIKGSATADDLENVAEEVISITAYAIQADGMADEYAAWQAGGWEEPSTDDVLPPAEDI